ncbi:hypothetical protein, partial [Ralstonia solanacearum]|uniref:hypothetical protein n=1 Tax=Ralstonia solanacearum TaxID=305 RepID=UPI001FFBE3E6
MLERAGLAEMGFVFVVHPWFHPLPGLTYFLCLAKESRQRKARPMWRKPPGLSVISCSRHNMLSRRRYASQTESQAG